MDKQKTTIIVLAIVIIFSFNYIFLQEYQKSRDEILEVTFNQGYEQGFEDAVMTIFQQTKECQVTPIWVGNFSKFLIDLDCFESISEPDQ